MKTVLVVEDTRAHQLLIMGLLTQAGFEVAVADTAELAWRWLDHTVPHLILLDVIMPGQSGLDLCRMIRASSQLHQIPIVFCTAKNQEADRFWALRQGGNAYIAKPFAPQQLLDAVYHYIN